MLNLVEVQMSQKLIFKAISFSEQKTASITLKTCPKLTAHF